ncbi:unnamed protein product [Prunus armeniaca]
MFSSEPLNYVSCYGKSPPNIKFMTGQTQPKNVQRFGGIPPNLPVAFGTDVLNATSDHYEILNLQNAKR